jgi:hypothetical protein
MDMKIALIIAAASALLLSAAVKGAEIIMAGPAIDEQITAPAAAPVIRKHGLEPA